MNTDEPLIYTTKGNIPLSSLRLETGWQDEPGYVAFRESYFLGDELVKQSVHVMHRGAGINAEAGRFGDNGLAPLTLTSIGS